MRLTGHAKDVSEEALARVDPPIMWLRVVVVLHRNVTYVRISVRCIFLCVSLLNIPAFKGTRRVLWIIHKSPPVASPYKECKGRK